MCMTGWDTPHSGLTRCRGQAAAGEHDQVLACGRRREQLLQPAADREAQGAAGNGVITLGNWGDVRGERHGVTVPRQPPSLLRVEPLLRRSGAR